MSICRSMRSSFIFKNRGFNNKAKSQHLGKYLGKCQVKEAVLFIPLYKMSKVLIPSCMKSFVNAPYAKKKCKFTSLYYLFIFW